MISGPTRGGARTAPCSAIVPWRRRYHDVIAMLISIQGEKKLVFWNLFKENFRHIGLENAD